MLLNAAYINENTKARLGFSFAFAVVFHIAVLFGISQSHVDNTIPSELLSLPTNVSIRFLEIQKPISDQPKIERKAEKPSEKKPIKQKLTAVKPVQQPETLNKIEPAATNQKAISAPKQITEQHVIQKIVPQAIPVVSDKSLKGKRVQPQYPDRALRMRQEGVVLLRVLISETGARQELKMHKPSQYVLLNQAAVKAVKKWTFEPNIVNGRAVMSWVEIPIEFKIQ